MTLYNLKTGPLPSQFRITKFDADLNVSSSYNVTETECECPQGHKLTCRHRKMLPLLLDRVDTAWFWHFEQAQWKDPTGQAHSDDFHTAIGCAEGARVTPTPPTLDAVALRGAMPPPPEALANPASLTAKPEPLEAPIIRRRL